MKNLQTFESFINDHDLLSEAFGDKVKNAKEKLEDIKSMWNDDIKAISDWLKEAKLKGNEKKAKEYEIKLKFAQMEAKGEILAATAKLQKLEALAKLK
jgi:hypothetical protein